MLCMCTGRRLPLQCCRFSGSTHLPSRVWRLDCHCGHVGGKTDSSFSFHMNSDIKINIATNINIVNLLIITNHRIRLWKYLKDTQTAISIVCVDVIGSALMLATIYLMSIVTPSFSQVIFGRAPVLSLPLAPQNNTVVKPSVNISLLGCITNLGLTPWYEPGNKKNSWHLLQTEIDILSRYPISTLRKQPTVKITRFLIIFFWFSPWTLI